MCIGVILENLNEKKNNAIERSMIILRIKIFTFQHLIHLHLETFSVNLITNDRPELPQDNNHCR